MNCTQFISDVDRENCRRKNNILEFVSSSSVVNSSCICFIGFGCVTYNRDCCHYLSSACVFSFTIIPGESDRVRERVLEAECVYVTLSPKFKK